MSHTHFQNASKDVYAAKARELYGDTPEYQEMLEKEKGRTHEQSAHIHAAFMELFREAGSLKESDPASRESQAMVERIKHYIDEHYYTCSPEVLSGLGKMYASGGDFTKNIDAQGGAGTGRFLNEAIQIYCSCS